MIPQISQFFPQKPHLIIYLKKIHLQTEAPSTLSQKILESKSLKDPQPHPLDCPVAIFIVTGGVPRERLSTTTRLAWLPGMMKEVTPTIQVIPRMPSRHKLGPHEGIPGAPLRCITVGKASAGKNQPTTNKKKSQSRKGPAVLKRRLSMMMGNAYGKKTNDADDCEFVVRLFYTLMLQSLLLQWFWQVVVLGA